MSVYFLCCDTAAYFLNIFISENMTFHFILYMFNVKKTTIRHRTCNKDDALRFDILFATTAEWIHTFFGSCFFVKVSSFYLGISLEQTLVISNCGLLKKSRYGKIIDVTNRIQNAKLKQGKHGSRGNFRGGIGCLGRVNILWWPVTPTVNTVICSQNRCIKNDITV